MIKTTLGQVADIITGPFGSSLHQYEYVSFGIPVIMPQDIGNRNLSYEKIAYITQEKANELSRYLVDTNDIVYARRGDIEKHAFITDNDKDAICGTGCLRVRIMDKNVNPLFLSFYLNKPETKKWISLHAVGSSMPNINSEILSKVPIVLPDKREQDSIASFLDNIDNKISNNNDICSDLESMAKLLYDYWFVQFDFPDENGKPYKSSGGKMVWNEELKREIPDGWKVKPLSKVLCLLRDGTHNPPKRIDSGIPLLTGTMFGDYFLDYSQATYITEDDYYTIHKQYKPNAGDIVITKIGTLGNVNYLRDKDIPIAIHCNSALLRFPDDYCGMFAFQYCKSKEFFARLKAAKGQSVQEFCSLDSIGSILMLVPDHKLTARYKDNMKSVLNQMINTQSENQELASLRDFLLPMLMNGQVKVKKEDDNE